MNASNATRPAIDVRGLAKSYGRTPALQPISLDIPEGSIFALLGHNGAGKTTLLKLVMNILRPGAGEATVLGEPSTSLSGDDFARIGYVSENQELPGWMKVGDFLRYQSGFYPQWNDTALIRRFDLPLKRKLKNLSRGQRMKVALASILAFRPALIVLDEPFSGLDPLVRDELIEALLDTVSDQPTTILLSSHDLAEIESFATHVAFLHNGRLLFSEEMPALSARFREVIVTLPAASERRVAFTVRSAAEQAEVEANAPRFPAAWLLPQISAHTVRFVHTQADTEPIEEQVRGIIPNATAIDMEPMTLRSIFLATVKSGRAIDNATTSEGASR